MDVIIIGAGVVGLSAARRLAALGARVTVLDAVAPGGRGSRAAAGVAVASARLWDDPELWAFAAAGRAALAEDLESLPNGAALKRGKGLLRVVSDERARDALAAKASRHRGELGRWIDAAELVTWEPTLEGTSLHGAFVNDEGWMVDAEGYLTALAQDAVDRGVVLRLSEPVREVVEVRGGAEARTDRGTLRADCLIVCAGAWSGGIAGLVPLPVRPVRGQMMTVASPSLRLGRIVSGSTYLAPWRDGEILVGATEEDVGFADQTTVEGLLHLAATLSRWAPRLREARFVRAWSGLRSVTSDGRPMIGRYPGLTSVFIATGHAGQGILTGALTARAVVDCIDCDRSELAAPFEPSRPLPR